MDSDLAIAIKQTCCRAYRSEPGLCETEFHLTGCLDLHAVLPRVVHLSNPEILLLDIIKDPVYPEGEPRNKSTGRIAG